MNKNPTVSVVMITYNHEKFIKEAIHGVLIQYCDFDIEFIIANDKSTDSTDEVITKYLNQLNIPDYINIEYIKNKENKGMIPNFVWGLQHASGKYIALCEGDDYWTDQLKLQKQVDFLEKNPNLIACHHWQKIARQVDGEFVEVDAPRKGHGYYSKPIASVQEIFSNKVRIKTRTNMFRNNIDLSLFTKYFDGVAFGDVPLSFILGKYGDFGFIDEEMAVYRLTGKGVSTSGLKTLGTKKFKIQHFKNWIDIWDKADYFYNYQYHKEAKQTISFFYDKIISNIDFSFKSYFSLIYYNTFSRKSSIVKSFFHFIYISRHFIRKLGVKLKRKIKRKIVETAL